MMRPRLRWWREVVTLVIFYELYSLARNTQGSGSTSPTHAFRNARVVINLERAIGLYHEESVQRLFLNVRPLVKALNVYYGTAHFIVTAGVLMWLFLRQPDRYARWRWALASTTLLALIGFVAFPLMPPRLITSDFGMGSYEDTLHTIGGLWNFEDGAIAKLSNQYAAMPSLHFAWSLWCCLALWPRLRSRWARVLAVLHPVITFVAIVATANHYWIDAVGGAATLLAGWLLGGVLAVRAVGRVATWPRLPARRGAVVPPARDPSGPTERTAEQSAERAAQPTGPPEHEAGPPVERRAGSSGTGRPVEASGLDPPEAQDRSRPAEPPAAGPGDQAGRPAEGSGGPDDTEGEGSGGPADLDGSGTGREESRARGRIGLRERNGEHPDEPPDRSSTA